jgi:hypothetical protein
MSRRVENLELLIGVVGNCFVMAAKIFGVGMNKEQFANITCDQGMVSLGK